MFSRTTLRIWTLAAAVAGLSAACERWGFAPPLQPPRLVFAETTYDFGRTPQGTAVTHTFAFRNAGGLDLRIDHLRTSCSCTAAVAPARPVSAGGEGAIEATFDTRDDFGRRTRTITVYSNDPAQAVITLTLRGDIDAEVAADPPQLYVGHLHRGENAANDVRLVVGSSAAVTFGPVEASGAVVESFLREAGAGAAGKRLSVAIKPDAPLGHFRETVAIHTTSRRRPLLTIPVTGTVVPEVPGAQRPG